MLASKALAKLIVDRYIRKLPKDDCEAELASLLESFRLSEINAWVNSKNLENAAKIQNDMPRNKIESNNIEKVRVWSRRF